MKKLPVRWLVGIMILSHACSYSDSDTFYVDPVPGDPPEIWVSTNLDTLMDPTVKDSLEVVYDVEIINSDFYQLEAFVTDLFVFNSDSTNESFWLDSTMVAEPGIDTLYLYFFFSTNSNSLADIVDLEYDVVSLKYPIIFEMGGAK
ncbi:MAG: hypothetical protein DRI70_07170 [Bacteroidetes bacterium]|nr:MAG: hypothetical protein DRI70_07170 [Bacteroidota bacterium]